MLWPTATKTRKCVSKNEQKFVRLRSEKTSKAAEKEDERTEKQFHKVKSDRFEG